MKSIKSLKNIKGKTALVRVDFNVPVKNGKVEDDFRIKKSLPTIKFLLKKGAKIILLSHTTEKGGTLKPMAKYLKIKFIPDLEVGNIKNGEAVLLENLRNYPGEMGNDLEFAKKLAKLGDFYVNDAFSVSHRAHASIVGIPKYLPSYAGFQLEEEIKNLSKVLKPKHPFLFILGGAKFSTKMPLIKKYIGKVDNLFIGGALSNDFLKARGYEVGKSLVDGENYGIESILKNNPPSHKASAGQGKLILPNEVLVKSGKKLINRNVNEVKKDEMIIDIGLSAEKILAPLIKKSKLILWNGPLGKYEDGGDKATKKILKLVLNSKAQVVIGGGDIVGVLSELKVESKKLKPNIFISTGGGATLDFLANSTLPGIKALR
ncbi:MAG: phosphoglycerate kinase [Candidatus Paceibacterota bacterium]|jgi:phosphoglycerate kinase